MSNRIALSVKNAPRGLHLQSFAVVWLLLDRFKAADWVWGVAGTVGFFILWILLHDFFTAEDALIQNLKVQPRESVEKVEL